MYKRIIVLPEELEVIETRLKRIENKILEVGQTNIGDPILGTDGVMKLLDVSRRTLQTWRDEGIIEFSSINNKFYYRVSAINKMLDKHLQKTEEV